MSKTLIKAAGANDYLHLNFIKAIEAIKYPFRTPPRPVDTSVDVLCNLPPEKGSA